MMRLTKRSVDALPVTDKDYLVWDQDMTGFGVRVYPSGKKTYLTQYRTGRRTKRYTLGQHGVLTAEEARTFAKQVLGDVARGGDPSADRQHKYRAPNISSLCDRFLEEYVAMHCKPATGRDYASLVARLIKPRIGPMPISEVTRADVVALHHSLRETPYQANRVASVLSKLFNLAEDWGLRPMGTNPARRIKKFREVEKKRYLTEAEQERLGEVLADLLHEGEITRHIFACFYLLLLTGCRLGEIQTLKWDYVTATHF